jgi:hypothetical protein
MTISATAVRFDDHTMWVDLTDGRRLGVPLAWFPRLLRATPAERRRVELSRLGLHWEAIDEDISIAGLLAGRGDMTRRDQKPVAEARPPRKDTIMAKRTTHRSAKGMKLYAVRDKKGQFKDIQTYKRAHGQDVKRKSKKEK